MPKLDSSNLRSASYDPVTKKLLIEFERTGAKYEYLDVPQSVYKNLLKAESHGEHHANSISSKYKFKKVKE